jgi:hypothetical protein
LRVALPIFASGWKEKKIEGRHRRSTDDDYHVEISGGIGAARYLSDPKEFSGIVFPTKHRIFVLQPGGHSVRERLVVSIDMDQLVLF